MQIIYEFFDWKNSLQTCAKKCLKIQLFPSYLHTQNTYSRCRTIQLECFTATVKELHAMQYCYNVYFTFATNKWPNAKASQSPREETN